jgi:hypothetical protein
MLAAPSGAGRGTANPAAACRPAHAAHNRQALRSKLPAVAAAGRGLFMGLDFGTSGARVTVINGRAL